MQKQVRTLPDSETPQEKGLGPREGGYRPTYMVKEDDGERGLHESLDPNGVRGVDLSYGRARNTQGTK